jgi:hypothetical protein
MAYARSVCSMRRSASTVDAVLSRSSRVSGEDLGGKSFAVPDWKVGDEIPLGGGNLRAGRGGMARG